MRSEQWFAARDELTGLLTNPKSRLWDGLPGALNAYVIADEECRTHMKPVLASGCEAMIKRYGVPVDPGRSVTVAIRKVRRLVLEANRRYSALLLKVLEARTSEARRAIEAEMIEYIAHEPVAYFRKEGVSLQNKLHS